MLRLEELGLSHNEALTYLAVLELGETTTGPVVRKTHLHRVLIYDALASLIQKGLASYVVKENIKYFQASNPENFVAFLDEKKAKAQELVPELNIMRSESTKQSAMIYEGVKGLKAAINNMLRELNHRDDHCVFASGKMADTLGAYYSWYQKEKSKKKILTRIIYDESFRPRKDVISITYGKIKFYPLGVFPTDTWIYKDKVLIVTYTAKPPVALLIVSQETADSYRKMFESFWKMAS